MYDSVAAHPVRDDTRSAWGLVEAASTGGDRTRGVFPVAVRKVDSNVMGCHRNGCVITSLLTTDRGPSVFQVATQPHRRP